MDHKNKKMKFNWGHGILIFLTIFVTLVISFIVFSLNQEIDLVAKDYYDKGANYSEQIEINKRSQPYQDSINVDIKNSVISIQLAEEMKNINDSISIYFYRPSDKKADFTHVAKMSDKIEIPFSKIKKGRYFAKFTWKQSNQTYNTEKEIFIE